MRMGLDLSLGGDFLVLGLSLKLLWMIRWIWSVWIL